MRSGTIICDFAGLSPATKMPTAACITSFTMISTVVSEG